MNTRSRRFRAAVASTVSLCFAAAAALALCWAMDGAFAVRAAPSGELHVCPAGPPTCDYSTIQGAVDAALSGDVIKVAAGVYADIHTRDGITQVVYISKTVTVQGGYTTTNWTTPDPVAQVTTLDAQGLGRVMVITGSIAPTLEGLHLTGGDAAGLGSAYYEDDAGGGLYVQKATATITGNTFYANSSGGIGGAIALYDSPSQITGNTITSNTTVGDGGGVFLVYSDATLRGNTITDNDAATRDGGGVFVFYSSAMLRDNTISRNWARNSGGGVGLYQSPATLERNTVTHNTSASAGGLNLYLSDATLSGNVVADNEAGNQGGAMQLRAGTVVLINNVISHNGIVDEPWRTGAGILVWDADCHLSHNTISGNHGGDGTGIHVMDSGFWFTFSTVEMTSFNRQRGSHQGRLR